MVVLVILGALALVLILFVGLNIVKEKQWKASMSSLGGTKDIPVMPGEYPLVGHLPTIALTYPSDSHFEKHEETFKKLNSGSFILRVPIRTYVLTIDPDVVKHIASTKFSTVYQKGQKAHKQYLQFLGRGIFNVNGEDWKKHRNVALGLFHANNLRNYVRVFQKTQNEFSLNLKV